VEYSLNFLRESRQQLVQTSWLQNRFTYIVLTPLLTLTGAATTIAAPMLLDPTSFGDFALLSSIFLYTTDFDLGLSRLSDRLLSTSNDASIVSDLLIARYSVASILAIFMLTLGYFTNFLIIVAGFAGIALMLSNGPMVIYRARSQIAALTLTSLLMQFGMTLPRLIGLLVDGVRGCILALALWFSMTAIVLNGQFLLQLKRLPISRLFSLFGESVPLFIFGSLWLLYLLSSRWVCWLISTPINLGLFSFGANLTSTGIALIGTISQAYYPRHLASPSSDRLSRELLAVMGLATAGCLAGVLFCRYALDSIFPHFIGSEACTSAMLFSSIPLSLSTWFVPLVIARSNRPLRESLIIVPLSIFWLFALMHAFEPVFGLEGLAWACFPPAMLMFGMQLHLVVRGGLLKLSTAIWLWWLCLAVDGLCALVWMFVFHG
jgi:hypothetical protein